MVALSHAPTPEPPASPLGLWLRRRLPVLSLLVVLCLIWYGGALYLNAPRVIAQLNSTAPGWTFSSFVEAAWSMKRPLLPAPHQIVGELLRGLFDAGVLSPRNLLYHAGVTLGAAACGFGLALAIGIGLAIMIVHVKFLDRALFPWVVASQAVPVIATAPMIVVVLGHLGFEGLLPKALIAASTAFFPIAISMVVGLRSADPIQIDLMETYNAGRLAVFTKLRWPAAMSFLLPSLKVAGALAIVGAIVGELPTGAQAGLGARLLVGSYNGLMLMMWAVLIMAGALAVASIGVIGLFERYVRARRGGRL